MSTKINAFAGFIVFMSVLYAGRRSFMIGKVVTKLALNGLVSMSSEGVQWHCRGMYWLFLLALLSRVVVIICGCVCVQYTLSLYARCIGEDYFVFSCSSHLICLLSFFS